MYPTSSDYKDAMRSPSRPYDTVYGTLTLTTGGTITIDGSVLPSNAITISTQCIENGELMFGGVFLGTLNISIMTNLSRYAFFGATITLNYKIQIGTTTEGSSVVPVYEVIPLGTYTVADATRLSDRVDLTCYDNMRLLDKELGGLILSGTPWEVLSVVSTETGYQLSFTESDLNKYINHGYQMQLGEDNGITSYRGAVKAVCQLLGCFACDDRTGKLRLKKFSSTADITLGTGDWYSLVPADYECNYVALSITSLAGTYTQVDPDPTLVGNMMVIDDAPAWDFGSATAQQEKTDNLFNYLTDIDYTPVDMDMPSDPSFECGDRLTLNAKINGQQVAISTLITSLEWKFHQGMTVTSEGINPYLEGNTALMTESNRIISQAIERSRLQFVSFTNARDKVVDSSTPVVIGEVSFTPTAETNGLMVATILVDIDVPDTTVTETESVTVPVTAYTQGGQETVVTDLQGNALTLTGTATNTTVYKRDGKCPVNIYYTIAHGVIETRVPNDEQPYTAIESLEDGRHIITVSYPLTGLTAYERFTFRIYMTSGGGTITVPAHGLEATIFGQEITTVGMFSGKIVAEDVFSLVSLVGIGVKDFAEAVSLRFTDPQYDVDLTGEHGISDTLNLYDLATINVFSLTDSVTITMTGRFPLWAEQVDSETGDNIELLAQDGTRFISE